MGSVGNVASPSPKASRPLGSNFRPGTGRNAQSPLHYVLRTRGFRSISHLLGPARVRGSELRYQSVHHHQRVYCPEDQLSQALGAFLMLAAVIISKSSHYRHIGQTIPLLYIKLLYSSSIHRMSRSLVTALV